MRILGVDPGLERAGVGCIEGGAGAPHVLECCCLTTSARQTLAERLAALHEGLCAVLDRLTPDVAVLEALYAHYRHPTTAILMGHARGVMCLAFRERGVACVEYLPTRVKKAVVGRGHATKEQVQSMVAALLHLPERPEPHDVSDALALALCHAHVLEHGRPLSAVERLANVVPSARRRAAGGPRIYRRLGAANRSMRA